MVLMDAEPHELQTHEVGRDEDDVVLEVRCSCRGWSDEVCAYKFDVADVAVTAHQAHLATV
jgi:hypothetical protein